MLKGEAEPKTAYNRRGTRIMVTPWGTWFWEQLLSVVEWYANGSHRPNHRALLRADQNNLEEAFNKVLRIEREFK
jgi:hypothetical protein